ncbi:MAG: LptF/LptG family permease [Chitinophagaceae bacterium]|nr:LptF/LptG family permease [Chitinophagaceae bacterium]
MIKKLDKLIVKAFTGPFLVTFLIAVFILVVQFFWLYIDDFVGKGVDTITLLKFISYVSATIVPLALPLGILLSSIMTFGNLGETFELVAIKSAGIPLIRFMRPLFVISGLLAVVAFLFTNYMIPVAELKMRTLLYDIRVAKPAFDIKEGVFYNKLEGYTIKIGKKENDSIIRNVVIYEQSYALQDNMILAEEGTMTVSPDQRFLYFNLKNGWRYQEKGPAGTIQTDYYRLGFKEYKKVFDLSSFKLNKTADSTFKNYYKMLSIKQLTKVVDSIRKNTDSVGKRSKRELSSLMPFQLPDSVWKQKTTATYSFKNAKELIGDSVKNSIASAINSKSASFKSQVDFISSDYTEQKKQLRLHELERHRKFSLSFACIVLFLIGAPLGSLIRKGGIGLPLVISVLFFILFFIMNTSGEKMVKEGVLTPFTGMWFSTFILIPVGAFLTYKAMQDSQLFNAEFYYRILRKLKLSKLIKEKS